jgi:hypothetical protein
MLFLYLLLYLYTEKRNCSSICLVAKRLFSDCTISLCYVPWHCQIFHFWQPHGCDMVLPVSFHIFCELPTRSFCTLFSFSKLFVFFIFICIMWIPLYSLNTLLVFLVYDIFSCRELFSETGSHHVAQAGLKLMILLPASDSQMVGLQMCTPYLAQKCFLFAVLRFECRAVLAMQVLFHVSHVPWFFLR